MCRVTGAWPRPQLSWAAAGAAQLERGEVRQLAGAGAGHLVTVEQLVTLTSPAPATVTCTAATPLWTRWASLQAAPLQQQPGLWSQHSLATLGLVLGLLVLVIAASSLALLSLLRRFPWQPRPVYTCTVETAAPDVSRSHVSLPRSVHVSYIDLYQPPGQLEGGPVTPPPPPPPPPPGPTASTPCTARATTRCSTASTPASTTKIQEHLPSRFIEYIQPNRAIIIFRLCNIYLSTR